jgi:hypothetical protein
MTNKVILLSVKNWKNNRYSPFFLLSSDELSPNQEVDMICVCFRHLTAVHGATTATNI